MILASYHSPSKFPLFKILSFIIFIFILVPVPAVVPVPISPVLQVLYTGRETPPNFVRVMIDVIRGEGVSALYRGIGPTLLRTFPATGALFYAMEVTKKILHDACL